jgi:hypothetical protein
MSTSTKLYKLKIEPLPVHIFGEEYASKPAEAHFTFQHMPGVVFKIGKQGGIIEFPNVELLIYDLLGIQELTLIIYSYCSDDTKALDILKNPHFKTELYIFDRPPNQDYHGFGVSNQMPVINKNGEAVMFFHARGPALCFHLCNK